MNVVYDANGKVPLTPAELAVQANAITRNKPFKPSDFAGANSRIQGAGHCDCGGNGEFELLPVYHSDVREGQKRYMFCRKCGCWSHL